jgi:hypothetical protein
MWSLLELIEPHFLFCNANFSFTFVSGKNAVEFTLGPRKKVDDLRFRCVQLLHHCRFEGVEEGIREACTTLFVRMLEDSSTPLSLAFAVCLSLAHIPPALHERQAVYQLVFATLLQPETGLCHDKDWSSPVLRAGVLTLIIALAPVLARDMQDGQEQHRVCFALLVIY